MENRAGLAAGSPKGEIVPGWCGYAMREHDVRRLLLREAVLPRAARGALGPGTGELQIPDLKIAEGDEGTTMARLPNLTLSSIRKKSLQLSV
jgi:hypothetical protein